MNHPDFGRLCYFCDVNQTDANSLALTPRDSYHKTVYVAELGLQIRSDVGTIAQVQVQLCTSNPQLVVGIVVVFDQVGAQPLSKFRLRLLTRSGGHAFVVKGLNKERAAYEITPIVGGVTPVEVTW